MMFKKVLTCETSGTISTQSKFAYGCWEFDVNKGADINNLIASFAIDSTSRSNDNGYDFVILADESLTLRSRTNGSSGALFVTDTSYIDNNTWYRLKVARLASEGVFKDIPTLHTETFKNDDTGANPYTTFTAIGTNGFSASGPRNACCGTDRISITVGEKYLVEFDAKINSGVFDLMFRSSIGFTPGRSNEEFGYEGHNKIVLTVISNDADAAIVFHADNGSADYEITNFKLSKVYDKDTFACFIKGGDFGRDNWTLIEADSGDNPVVDSTYDTSKYITLDLDAGDKITNIKHKKQVEQ